MHPKISNLLTDFDAWFKVVILYQTMGGPEPKYMYIRP